MRASQAAKVGRTHPLWGEIAPYVRIARPDYWFKNVFMLPGALFALSFVTPAIGATIGRLALGVAATCLIASANYVINEFLDREHDRHHPVKRHRPSVCGLVKPSWVAVEYVALLLAGFGLGANAGGAFLAMLLALAFMGLVYNVKPLRSKDVIYLDVLSESVNNALRLALGWFIVCPTAFPPSSLLISYWLGGAFLMGIKRFAEYRAIDDKQAAGRYRRSFAHYTEASLLISSFFYALSSAFFGGIFLVKYRVELIVLMPFLAGMFAWYLWIGFKPDSAAQRTERLYRERRFIVYVGGVFALLVVLLTIRIPLIDFLVDRTPIPIF